MAGLGIFCRVTLFQHKGLRVLKLFLPDQWLNRANNLDIDPVIRSRRDQSTTRILSHVAEQNFMEHIASAEKKKLLLLAGSIFRHHMLARVSMSSPRRQHALQ